MDAFYASVEVLEDPSLAGRPVIVGGTGDRGVVASCSYEARAYGVRSAMPSGRARRLCPGAVFLPGSFDRYNDYSRRLHEVLVSFTPLVEGIALDEAFLDVGGARRLLGPAPDIGAAIRRRIVDDLGLRRVGRRRHLQADRQAGVGGGQADGLPVRRRARPRASWWSSPARSSPSCTLTRCRPCGASARPPARGSTGSASRPWATSPPCRWTPSSGTLGPALGRHLHDLAWARDDRPVEPDRAVRSIGHEETFGHDLFDVDRLHVQVVRQCDAVATRLRRAGVAGRTVTLKVRFGDFRTITRSRTIPRPRARRPGLARVAAELLDGVDCSPGVRLVGVSVSNLAEPESEQLRLEESGWGQRGGPSGRGRPAAFRRHRRRSRRPRRAGRAAAAAHGRPAVGTVVAGPEARC